MRQKLFIYTRIPDDKFCLPSFGNSIHFAVSEDGESVIPLNQNRGILYARGEISEEDQIVEKGLAQPEIHRLPDGRYAILARRTDGEGRVEADHEEERLLWLTEDLVAFQACGLVNPKEHPLLGGCSDDRAASSDSFPFSGVAAGSWMDIEESEAKRLRERYVPPHNTWVDVPAELVASSADDVREFSLTAHYSDGTTAQKKYDISDEELRKIDFDHPGTYSVTASLRQRNYPFPLAVGFADPVIFFWNERYYYISTNDNTDDVGFWVREADRVSDLFLPETEQHLILDKDEERKRIQTFWAPEFHVIGGRVYILFAVSGEEFGPQCHMMRLRENGSITQAEDWEEPVRVRKKGEAGLTEDGITLDMTYFEDGGTSYLVWSYRKNCMAEGDTGSMLYIASTDPEEPWMLTSDPVRLSRPLYGWENVDGTINNEGPYPLITEDRIYIAYSGGSACNWTYAVGLLCAEKGADLLDPDCWEKSTCPALSTSDLNGVYGPGHNSFFTDRDGDTYIAYHGEVSPYDSPRSTAIHRVHFDPAGRPVLNLCGERDVRDEYRSVSVVVRSIG